MGQNRTRKLHRSIVSDTKRRAKRLRQQKGREALARTPPALVACRISLSRKVIGDRTPFARPYGTALLRFIRPGSGPVSPIFR